MKGVLLGETNVCSTPQQRAQRGREGLPCQRLTNTEVKKAWFHLGFQPQPSIGPPLTILPGEAPDILQHREWSLPLLWVWHHKLTGGFRPLLFREVSDALVDQYKAWACVTIPVNSSSFYLARGWGGGSSWLFWLFLALHLHQWVFRNDRKMCLGHFPLCWKEGFPEMSDANFSMFSSSFPLRRANLHS